MSISDSFPDMVIKNMRTNAMLHNCLQTNEGRQQLAQMLYFLCSFIRGHSHSHRMYTLRGGGITPKANVVREVARILNSRSVPNASKWERGSKNLKILRTSFVNGPLPDYSLPLRPAARAPSIRPMRIKGAVVSNWLSQEDHLQVRIAVAKSLQNLRGVKAC